MHSDVARCFLRFSDGCRRRGAPPSPVAVADQHLNPPVGGTFTNRSTSSSRELRHGVMLRRQQAAGSRQQAAGDGSTVELKPRCSVLLCRWHQSAERHRAAPGSAVSRVPLFADDGGGMKDPVRP
ncbi:hypothetical protein [Streptomyces nigrescens]|uniref:hypothetical protein n=1 Tax=Streptomyces nigrescens TaxID=1920 RepID=UPI0022559ABF|nr:hypothetical protein [Streptomyces libani]MCX5446574.1 hypothetical protein [Streptomyces libani]